MSFVLKLYALAVVFLLSVVDLTSGKQRLLESIILVFDNFTSF